MTVQEFFSFSLYLGTFITGIFIGYTNLDKNSIFVKIYTIWLFAFLCFGYTVGSDWRSYEQQYYDGVPWWSYRTEPISLFVIRDGHSFISDYWLLVGLLKCLYLSSLMCVFKRITSYYLTAVSLLMPLSLVFILLDNPLRFMMALIFFNISLVKLLNYNNNGIGRIDWVIITLCFISSILCQNTIIVSFFFLLSFLLKDRIIKQNRFLLLLLYVIVNFLSSQIAVINYLKDNFMIIMSIASDNLKDYSNYEIEDNSAAFLIGNIIKIGLFCIIIMSKDSVVNRVKNGRLIYSLTVSYFFLDRIVMLVPTGFRLVIPFTYFLAIYIYYLMKVNKKYSVIFILYLTLQFSKNIYESPFLIPYTNSITHILLGHDSYIDRYNLNIKSYERRCGRTVDY